MQKPAIQLKVTTPARRTVQDTGYNPVWRLLRDWLASEAHAFTRWAVPILGFALFAGIAGCATPSAPPPPPTAATTANDATEFDTARKLYINHCGRCHKFYNPNKYSSDDWNSWMRKMAKKSKLTSEQEEMLGRHLALYRSEK